MKSEDDYQDRRRFQRILFDAPARIQGNQGSRDVTLIDVSLNGALIVAPLAWESDLSQEYWLRIQLSGDTAIEMLATVAHKEDGHIGFRCQHIDMDSISHLRRLVELNLGNSRLLERELDALG